MAGPGEVEGMNHRCSCTGGMTGLAMAGWGLMSGLRRIGSFECYQIDTPGTMEQGCAAAAVDDSGPMSTGPAGERSLVYYQTDTMKRCCAADIVAAEGWRMSG